MNYKNTFKFLNSYLKFKPYTLIDEFEGDLKYLIVEEFMSKSSKMKRDIVSVFQETLNRGKKNFPYKIEIDYALDRRTWSLFFKLDSSMVDGLYHSGYIWRVERTV